MWVVSMRLTVQVFPSLPLASFRFDVFLCRLVRSAVTQSGYFQWNCPLTPGQDILTDFNTKQTNCNTRQATFFWAISQKQNFQNLQLTSIRSLVTNVLKTSKSHLQATCLVRQATYIGKAKIKTSRFFKLYISFTNGYDKPLSYLGIK